ncbi:MAG: 1-acyl-sn-glycerol-3-phosphate acyltransferase [Bacteroidia bacterium]|nr:1-acyl-sn-glycerol-3-phosphate acyltransferase [Bacteroidia bacterium]
MFKTNKKLHLQSMSLLIRIFLKIIYIITARTFYSKIVVLNAETVPHKKPLLIAVNHSNAFWDGVMIGLHLKQKVWFLARGDVFKNTFVAKILNAIGITPIYRMQEGIENLEKNNEVFNRCYQLLKNHSSVLIFPEGNCERESVLRPLKKGAARIAHGAIQYFPENKELYVVGAAINYDEPDNLNSEVYLVFNKTFKVSDYFSKASNLDGKSAARFTNDVAQSIDEVMFNIHDRDKLSIFHFIKRNFDVLITGNSGNDKVKFEKIKHFSQLINTHQTAYYEMASEVILYKSVLEQYKLREKQVNKYLIQKRFFDDYLVFVILSFSALPALVFNSWPYLLSYRVAKKTAKKPEFFSSVNIGSAGLLYFLWYVILLIGLVVFFTFVKALLIIVVLHICGITALHWLSTYRAIKAQRRIFKLKEKERNRLLTLRKQCIEAIIKFIS